MNDIKDIVHRVVGNMAQQQTTSSQKLDGCWQKALEKKELEHTQLVDFKNGSLLVNVDSSAWLYQMNTRKGKILEKLKEEISDIKNINFRVGKVK